MSFNAALGFLITGTLLLVGLVPMRLLAFTTAVVDLTTPAASKEFTVRSIILQHVAVGAHFVSSIFAFKFQGLLYDPSCSSVSSICTKP
jgi:hypothetical protein